MNFEINGRLKCILFACSSIIVFQTCTQHATNSIGPFFGNGVHNGWADQESIVIWTRLTKTKEGNLSGLEFTDISKDQHKRYRKLTNRDSLYWTQVPFDTSLEDMIGACPGTTGEVKLSYHIDGDSNHKKEIDWQGVEAVADYSIQWSLTDLKPNSVYQLYLEARADATAPISDTLIGKFRTAPLAKSSEDIDFVVTTCHDFIRRDDTENGHKIYPSMANLNPDFYVHTGDIEYYDKPLPYAMTEDLMHFKWNRLFALPFQRDFWSNHTCYFMKDDHDVLADDSYPGMTYGEVSWERGLKIFDHIQFPRHDQRYKTIRWGKDLQIWIVEGRNFRSKNTDLDGPEKTIWGKRQKEWFFQTIDESDATFKVLMSSSPILGPDRDNKKDNYSNKNFTHEGQEIRDFINQHDNIIICNGDRHWQFVTHFENTNLWEFSCGPGADDHAGGWKQEDKRPQHKFLRVKGGFLSGHVSRTNDTVTLRMQHHDVNGNIVNEETFIKPVL